MEVVLANVRTVDARIYSDIETQTVNISQGKEADILILSLARANDKSGFIHDEARLNVGLSRGRFARYVLGNARFFLDRDNTIAVKSFVSYM